MMLYGVTYETYKELIDSNVEKFQSELNGRLDQTVKKVAGASKKAFFIQLIFGFCEIAVLMFILILFQKSYINPVMKYKAMYQVLIVEDDKTNRLFYEKLKVWEEEGFVIADQAIHGPITDFMQVVKKLLLTWAAYSIFIAMSPYTNGNVGISQIQSLLGSLRGPKNEGNLIALFYIALVVLIVVYAASTFLIHTKFGKLMIAIRDGENRTYFSGYCVSNFKNFVYVLSAIFAAIAGASFVNFNGSITPTQMSITYSITMIIWVAIGRRGTLIGAVIGAFLINLCEYNLSSGSMAESWQYIIGLLFVITILFFKGGIVGIVRDT